MAARSARDDAAWAQVEADIAALLEADGYELVEFDVSAGRGAQVRLAVDHREAPGTITVDECAELSRRIGRLLDLADPLVGSYRLMVSSPGVDRPLSRLEHCLRAVGQTVRVSYRRDGRRATVIARLTAIEGDTLQLEGEAGSVTIAWPEVLRANVVYDWGD